MTNVFLHLFFYQHSHLKPEQLRVQHLWQQCGVKVYLIFPSWVSIIKQYDIIPFTFLRNGHTALLIILGGPKNISTALEIM